LKQVVVFTEHVRKDGVKKELAIGDAVRKKISDSKFMIPVRSSGVEFTDAPPEFLRDHIINAHPNWHDCLAELLETLEEANIPRTPSPDTEALARLVEAREDGRRFVIERREQLLTNWFLIQPPPHIRYYGFDGLQEQMKAWLKDCQVPHVPTGRLAGSFADPAGFAMSSAIDLKTPTEYEIPFSDFISGTQLGPYSDKRLATNDVSNLLRQHFDKLSAKRGLLRVEFANKDVGWFFPDGLLPGGKIVFQTPSGRTIRRVMSGKFKDLRWHACIIAKPRVWPQLVYRIHINVVLTTDGKHALPGDKTHARRRRLTKSWWNNIWRDRLLAAMNFLAEGAPEISIQAGNINFTVGTWPQLAESDASYDAIDPPLPVDEDDEGNIVPTAALEDQMDDSEEFDASEPTDSESRE
jgi:hypothetical protein